MKRVDSDALGSGPIVVVNKEIISIGKKQKG